MSSTANPEKAKQPRPKWQVAVFTALWLVLLGAAMAFIAFAGHI
jgi:hypothetical protein